MSAASLAAVAHSEERVVKVRHCVRTGKDVELCFDTFGDSANPPLVLVMGLNGQMTLWDEELCRRFAQDFFVIRYDNRDVGKSTKFDECVAPSVYAHVLPWWLQWTRTTEPYTLNCMAEDLWALVDTVVGAGAKAHLVGTSMGGMISQCATLAKPDRVLSLTSWMSTTGAKDLPEPAFWVKWELTKAPKSLSVEDRVDFRVQLMHRVLAYGQEFDEERCRANAKITAERSTYIKGFIRQVAAIQRAPDRDPLWRALGDKAPPTLVIHGRGDVLVPLAAGQRTADVIHGAKLVVFDDMGHNIDVKHFHRVLSEIYAIAQKRRA